MIRSRTGLHRVCVSRYSRRRHALTHRFVHAYGLIQCTPVSQARSLITSLRDQHLVAAPRTGPSHRALYRHRHHVTMILIGEQRMVILRRYANCSLPFSVLQKQDFTNKSERTQFECVMKARF